MPSKFTISFFFLLSLNVLCMSWLGKYSMEPRYTFVGDDYPIELPGAHKIPLAAMSLQESVHYNLNLSDPFSEDEWVSMISHPFGLGRIHLGTQERLFNTVFWHQLHCIRELDRAIKDPTNPHATPYHVRHCLNYLRQQFLCEADYTLEWGDFMRRDFEQERLADTRECRDWEVVYNDLEDRMHTWAKSHET